MRRWNWSLPQCFTMYLLQQIRPASKASLLSCSHSLLIKCTQRGKLSTGVFFAPKSYILILASDEQVSSYQVFPFFRPQTHREHHDKTETLGTACSCSICNYSGNTAITNGRYHARKPNYYYHLAGLLPIVAKICAFRYHRGK